ncbi:Oidioi.mRNA.OKI2018_I69.XSR.g13459.t1.cds [Oikopleura dioica]|uniref:Oidioi.mRNA.OKI2018_I69.XSR.g13459.t1.cds n=1 Tax=Oikopleura dioica TaxID=34765 RepID=A0ABN7SC37_OIKDI|nr:Oidioi.mRNA.OKI2018_I69.XSR.g13459.t1.cds [Oikopleura dioica]
MPKHRLLKLIMGAVCQKSSPPGTVGKPDPGVNGIEEEQEIRFRTDTEEGYVRLSTNSSLTSDLRASSSRILSEPLPDPSKNSANHHRTRAFSCTTNKAAPSTPLKSPIRSKSTFVDQTNKTNNNNSEDENDDVFLEHGSNVFRLPKPSPDEKEPAKRAKSADDGYSRIQRNPAIPSRSTSILKDPNYDKVAVVS